MSGTFNQPDTEEDFEYRVLVVGYSGSGKSSLANKLMDKADVESSRPGGNLAEGDQPSGGFMVSKGFDTATRKSQFQTARLRRNGRVLSLKVVDTPGLYSLRDEDPRKARAEIRRGVSLCSPGGPHVVLYALPLERFSEQQERSFEDILQLFGKEGERHLLVVFTHGENLKGKSIEEVLDRTPVKGLKKVREVVGTRYVVTSNLPECRESEMEVLWEKLLQVKESCGGQPLSEKEATVGNVDAAAVLGFVSFGVMIVGFAFVALKYHQNLKKYW